MQVRIYARLLLEHAKTKTCVRAIDFETRYVSRQLLEGFPAVSVSFYVYVFLSGFPKRQGHLACRDATVCIIICLIAGSF